MKTKILTMFLMTALLSMSLVMATDFSLSTSSLKFENKVNVLTFEFTPPTDTNGSNQYNFTLDFPNPAITLENGQSVGFTYNSSDLTNIDSTTPITVTVTSDADHNQLSIGKEYTGKIKVKNVANTTDYKEITVNFVGSFCSMGENGTNLEINDIKINNDDGDDEDWSPLDKIEVEVEVENIGNEKVRDVTVELAVFDSSGKNIVKDLENLDDEEIDLGSIKEDDEETAIFEFTVPADFESGDYRLAIKAYSDDLEEENECTAKSDDLDNTYFQEIVGEREEDSEKHVVFDDIRTNSPAQCGDKIQVSGDLVNIGDEDYEDQLKVTLYNSELGLELEQIVREDLEEGETESVEFEFEVPEDAEEKLYNLKFKTYYDYDEDDDSYDEESEEEFSATLRVAGNCHSHDEDATITSEFDSETPNAVAGKQVIIKSTVTNTGDVETMYTLSVNGINDWATLASIDDQVFTLAAGENKEVNIILNVDSNAEGDKGFTIKTTYGENKITEHKVSLSISASNTQLTPFVDNVKSNWFIYVIILVNIILIIAIISVIRSMVSPRPL
jgi:uncharacterized membrane protein